MAVDLLRRPRVELNDLFEAVDAGGDLRESCAHAVAAELDEAGDPCFVQGMWLDVVSTIKYNGYINKIQRQLDAQAHLDHLEIPGDLCYDDLTALSLEAREKLTRIRPSTLGRASRIDGVRAGDLAVLTVMLKRERQRDETGRGER